jgi:17beta-estradiol 17-dehydrogenase / very-long-chain 3-oxoacyl-CoA reductase
MDLSLTTLLSYVGALWIAITIAKVLRFVELYTRSGTLKRFQHPAKDGSKPWAVITGASDGIGKSYAHELASQGFNVVLHGRNQKKLEGVRDGLKKEFPKVEFKIVVIDAFVGGAEGLKKIQSAANELKNLHITILINNIGGGARVSGAFMFPSFDKDELEDIDALINLNARFPAQITRALLPSIIAHGKPALILNMLSFASAGSPYLSIYSASKEFNHSWTRALAREMRAENRPIEVLGIMTAQVSGTVNDNGAGGFLRPSAVEFAKSALKRVGCGEMVVEGCWTHGLLGRVTGLLPRSMFTKVLIDAMREEIRLEGEKRKMQ